MNCITEPITFIINSCISQGVFPDKLKFACVTPLFKSGTRDDPNNYRPISILPTLSKIFERHIANQLKQYLKENELLYYRQSGFRENHSCQTALIRLIDDWLSDIDNGKLIGTVYLDFRKAFDMVDHEILLHKLRLYHFSDKAYNLFESYLNNRYQIVKNGSFQSDPKLIVSGVPQGSILGPLLFLLFVNDLPLCIDKSNIDMYADDATLHKSLTSVSQVKSALQNDIIRI